MKYLMLITILLLSACATAPNPDASNINAKLGLAYLQQGDAIRAKNKLLLALEEDPKNYAAQDAFGYFLEKTGNAKSAEKYYIEAIKLAKPKEKGIAWNSYAEYLYQQKNYTEAQKYFLLAANDLYYLQVADAYKNAANAASKLKH